MTDKEIGDMCNAAPKGEFYMRAQVQREIGWRLFVIYLFFGAATSILVHSCHHK